MALCYVALYIYYTWGWRLQYIYLDLSIDIQVIEGHLGRDSAQRGYKFA
jgi:hypothetical protein